jgi:hypothetical protein
MLHVIYVEDPTLSEPEYGVFGGTAKYVFQNRLNFPVKIAFPPISYVSGPGWIRLSASSDPQYMPSFCCQPRLVEIPGNGEVSFESPFTYFGSSSRPPEPRFIFGNPEGVSDGDLLICPVIATSEWQKKGPTKP